MPDRDFYYLIGVRIGNGASAVRHSLWADSVEDEGRIWRELLRGGVDFRSRLHRPSEDRVIVVKFIVSPRRTVDLCGQQLPGFDTVEQFEQNNAEEKFFGRTGVRN